VDTPRSDLDEEQDVEAAQRHSVDAAEVGRDYGLGLERMNCAHDGPVRRGVGSTLAVRKIFQTLDAATL
jgi:hypothetical protein